MINEIIEIQKKLYIGSSTKEKAFFSYLNGSPLNYNEVESPSDAEKLVLQAFSKNPVLDTSLASKYLKTKPVKNIHFSQNLIELCSVAKLEYSSTEEYLKAYYENSNSRDRWIINTIFPNILFRKKDEDKFNELIDQVSDQNINNSMSVIMNYLEGVEDLLDVFLIKDVYIKSIQNNIEYLLISHRRILNFSNGISSLIVNIIYFVAAALIIFLIFKFLPAHWEVAEAYLTVLQFAIVLFTVLLLLIFQKRIDQISILRRIKLNLTEKLLKIIYMPYGIQPNKVISILDRNKINYE